VDVGSRDLTQSPFDFLVFPVHETDLTESVRYFALGLDGNGQLIAVASFGQHPFTYKSVDKYQATLQSALPHAASATDDGCFCATGYPMVGSGKGTGCDLDVVTSLPRLVDTAGCELPPGARQLTAPVCDGQDYDDPVDRQLPCYATHNGVCRLGSRRCHDRDGVSYAESCEPGSNGPMLSSTALCDAYQACDRACGDVLGCFRKNAPQGTAVHCTIHVDDAGVVCGGSGTVKLRTTATGADCVASIVDGSTMGLYSITLDVGAVTSSTCPPTVTIAGGGSPIPTMFNFGMTIGAQVVEVDATVVVGCTSVLEPVSCQ
jgi:hypothetical protein